MGEAAVTSGMVIAKREGVPCVSESHQSTSHQHRLAQSRAAPAPALRFVLAAAVACAGLACSEDDDGVTLVTDAGALSPDGSSAGEAQPPATTGRGPSNGEAGGGGGTLAGAGGNGGGGASGGAGGTSSTDPGAPPASGGEGGNDAELPDLVLDAAYLVDTTTLDTVTVDDMCLLQESCVTGLGERRVVRFGSRTGNVGNADFVLGATVMSNPLWTFDTCQEAYDLVGFARYVLLDRATGETVVVGAKNGFCIADAEQWTAESGASCDVYDCSNQGISRGCADNYGSALECQWVDVTDVPPGEYELRVTINADRNVEELDYENNTVRVPIELSQTSVTVVP